MLHGQKLQELIVHLGRSPKVSNLGPTKLWKLIYFIDARAVRDLGESITGSEFIKYEHGPVPSRGEKFLKQLVREGSVSTAAREVGGMTLNEVKSNRAPHLGIFSPEELSLINEVCAELGGKSAAVLSNLSHSEPAWHYAEFRQKLSRELIAYGHEEDPTGL